MNNQPNPHEQQPPQEPIENIVPASDEPVVQQPTTESETSIPQPENKDMEVHHHAHHGHEKKTWKNYFWEFFMLFLAVFCGSLAELQLEHYIERKRESQYIEALVRDLKADTASFNIVIPASLRREKLLENLLAVSNLDLTINANAKQLVNLFMGVTGQAIHYPSTIAITQFKSTGSFRLLNHKKGVIDSIFKYDLENDRILNYGSFNRNEFELMWETFYPICDVKIFRDTTFAVFNNSKRILKDVPIPPLHLSQEKLSLFTGHVTRQTNYNLGYIFRLETQRQRAIQLLLSFKKNII
jgi:hypothetical protein